MKKGTLEKVFAFYDSPARVKTHVIPAMLEFFNVSNREYLEKINIQDDEMPYFRNWFLFDYRLSDGMSILEDYLERNKKNISSEERCVYKSLAQNIYGFFKIEAVDLDKSITVENLASHAKYTVCEKIFTHQATKGLMTINRIGWVIDHWEFVGNNSFGFLPCPEIKSLLRMLDSRPMILTPQLVNEVFVAKRHYTPPCPE